MVNSYFRASIPLALILMGLADVSTTAHAGDWLHGGSTFSMKSRGPVPGFGIGTGFPMTTGASLSSSPYLTVPYSGSGLAAFSLAGGTNPFTTSQLTLNSTAGLSIPSAGFTIANVPAFNAGYFTMSTPGQASSLAGGIDSAAIAEYWNYQSFKVAAGRAGGPSLASVNPSMQLAAKIAADPKYSVAAGLVGEGELASIAGYLSQFAGRPEFWQKAFNLLRVFAQNNPFVNLDSFTPFLNEIFQGGGGSGTIPTPAPDNQELTKSIRELTSTVKKLEARLRVIEDLTPRISQGDKVTADPTADGAVTVNRAGQSISITKPGSGLKKGDVILQVLDDGRFRVLHEGGTTEDVGTKTSGNDKPTPQDSGPDVAPIPPPPETINPDNG